MEIETTLKKLVIDALKELNIVIDDILLEHPTELEHGDYSTNIAMMLAKKEGKEPQELAQAIVDVIREQNSDTADVAEIGVAHPGFINFRLSRSFYARTIGEIIQTGDEWGKTDVHTGKKVMVEFTDPNPFKAFHIGHLMSNAIGESISRLIEFSGAEVKRANYQGDVGPHVAKALWGLMHDHGSVDSAEGLGAAYAAGAAAYEEDEAKKKEIDDINTSVYESNNKEITELYEKGRQVSLDHFEDIYAVLGTTFDYYFFESQTWYEGTEIVKRNVPDVFTESDGAIVFHGEEHDKKLHTRVFLNSKGLPTYETKDIGLVYAKKEKYDMDLSIYITAVEQAEYFKVWTKALEQFDTEAANKIVHLAHGMMKLPTGKMSSRSGDVITALGLIDEVKNAVLAVETEREIEDKEQNVEIIAIAALKYSILKQHTGKDTVYDLEKSLSFEGDSGPYLQYARTRAHSILEKANKGGNEDVLSVPKETSKVEALIYRFPEVVREAAEKYEPHHITNYLTELAGAFNSFYAQTKIIGGEHEIYYLGLTKAFRNTMTQGLHLLGIKSPERM